MLEKQGTTGEPWTAVLVSVQPPGVTDEEAGEFLEELAALASTAGANATSSVLQRRSTPDPATLLGSGKAREVAGEVEASGASLVIFDNELSIGQQDRLAELLGARVVDRTALILEIFAQHAHTAEGRVQVELAQYSYLLPRIRGYGMELSRMGGGIGTRRGPGETKLEVDRRRIRKRIHRLEAELERLEAVRRTQRKRRVKAGLPSVCLVGYTNSGKSSLLNRLTGAGVPVEDQLFSTLDSTTRRMALPGGLTALLSDTVGFIRKLPHELVAAFRSTLEVVRDSDLLLHVIDPTRSGTMEARTRSVEAVLSELGAEELPVIEVINKVDTLDPAARQSLESSRPAALQVSARTGEGLSVLLGEIATALSAGPCVTVRVPVERGDVISRLHREGTVLSSEVDGESMVITARLPADRRSAFSPYLAGDGR